MGYKSVKSECPTCKKQTAFRGSAPNHLLHGILTLGTCGIWGIVWLYVTLFSKRLKPYTCETCGSTIMLPG